MFDFHPHPLDWLHFKNTLSFVRGRFDEQIDGSENLPQIPHSRWISELRGDFFKKGNSLRNLYFFGRNKHGVRATQTFPGLQHGKLH